MQWNHLRHTITDTLFTLIAPHRCICCNEYDHPLCDVCYHALCAAQRTQHCHHCRRVITADGSLCDTCRGTSVLRSVFVCSDAAHRTVLLRAIAAYKYHGIRALRTPLSRLMCHALQSAPLRIPDVIIPIPLHPWRERWRTFNQSAELAEDLAQTLTPHLPLRVSPDALRRKRYTRAQARHATRQERERNVHDAFTVHRPTIVRGANILLIDDVATTTATLRSAATALHHAGARRIDAAVLVRD